LVKGVIPNKLCFIKGKGVDAVIFRTCNKKRVTTISFGMVVAFIKNCRRKPPLPPEIAIFRIFFGRDIPLYRQVLYLSLSAPYPSKVTKITVKI